MPDDAIPPRPMMNIQPVARVTPDAAVCNVAFARVRLPPNRRVSACRRVGVSRRVDSMNDIWHRCLSHRRIRPSGWEDTGWDQFKASSLGINLEGSALEISSGNQLRGTSSRA